jgi:hypothetical protein
MRREKRQAEKERAKESTSSSKSTFHRLTVVRGVFFHDAEVARPLLPRVSEASEAAVYRASPTCSFRTETKIIRCMHA